MGYYPMIITETTLHQSINTREEAYKSINTREGIYFSGIHYTHISDKNKRIMRMRRVRFKKIDFKMISLSVSIFKKYLK